MLLVTIRDIVMPPLLAALVSLSLVLQLCVSGCAVGPLLTALAAVLAFIPLTTSVFWGSMACTLIGGTAAGTALTLLFLPARYAIWFHVEKPASTPALQPFVYMREERVPG